jgi:aryl-alcohol dehydrogenase-like predicted oxidoreductase
MNSNVIANGSLHLSVFGLGTMTFGAESNEATAHAMLDRYVAAGGTLVDTADVYTRGESERIIGTWLASRGNRDRIVIATKGRFPMSDDPSDRGAGRAWLTQAVDDSLARLGVDVIDLYQVHAWDPEVPLAETLGVLDELVTAGKIRHAGVSNYTGWQLQRAVLTGRHEGLTPVVSLQAQYNLLGREIELEILPVCLEQDVGVLVWSPLAGGWLSGKYSPDERPTGPTRLGDDPNRGIEAYDIRNRARTWAVIEIITDIATDREVSPAQVSLNWLRGRPGVASVLLGTRTVQQLDDNLAALDWELNSSERNRLDLVSAPGVPLYPHGFLEAYAGMTTWADLATRAEPPPIAR